MGQLADNNFKSFLMLMRSLFEVLNNKSTITSRSKRSPFTHRSHIEKYPA